MFIDPISNINFFGIKLLIYTEILRTRPKLIKFLFSKVFLSYRSEGLMLQIKMYEIDDMIFATLSFEF